MLVFDTLTMPAHVMIFNQIASSIFFNVYSHMIDHQLIFNCWCEQVLLHQR